MVAGVAGPVPPRPHPVSRVPVTTARYVHGLAERFQRLAGEAGAIPCKEAIAALGDVVRALPPPPSDTARLYRDRFILFSTVRLLSREAPSAEKHPLEMLIEFVQRPAGVAERVAPSSLAVRVRAWLDRNVSESRSLRDIAAAWDLPPSALSREFSRCYGLSPTTYLTILRIERATALIHTGIKIEAAAKLAGTSKATLYRHITSPAAAIRGARGRQSHKI